ncbi:serine/threonine-protein kinase [Streptomyces sp. NPDC001732]
MRGEILDGRYRLTEPIGSGGMGRVWRAEDERIGRKVAVKVLSRIDEDTSATRFAREARVVGGLSSPHIVTLHDFGEAQVAGERVLYLVMEHLQGRDLGAVLESRSPDLPEPSEAVGWAVEICAGLETAHRAGIVHRDIKPANILLTTSGTVKILDFGIARMLSTAAAATRTDLTGTGFMIGTPLYMSPEQIQAPDVLDSRSDLYSLGCLLYHLLTGRPPFTGAGTAVLARHLGNVPEPPSAHRPGLREFGELDALVMRLLAKDPDERPKDAAEVAALLRRAAGSGRADDEHTGDGDAGTGTGGEAGTGGDAGAPAGGAHASPAPAAAPVVPSTRVLPSDKSLPLATQTPPSPAPQPPPSAPFPTAPGPFHGAPYGSFPVPSPVPERLRVSGRDPRNGLSSPGSVAATWLAGAGTALVTYVLAVLFTPVDSLKALPLSVGACLVGMAAARGFTNVFDPLSKTLGHRILSALWIALPLGMAGLAIQEALSEEDPPPFFWIALGANVAAMTVGVLIADRLITMFRVPARAALLVSMSGWVNGLGTWGMLAFRTPLGAIGSLVVGCVVWLVTALGLGRILAPGAPRTGTLPGGRG